MALKAGAAESAAQFTFGLSSACDVSTRVMNVAGREVRVLPPQPAVKGMNILVWDGVSGQGLRVPAGVYLVEVTAQSVNGDRARAVAPLHLTR